MRAEDVARNLALKGALLEGHFLLSSGLHSDRYMQCARALEDPVLAGELGKALAELAPEGVETVVSPALGGILIGYEVARNLGARFLFAEREAGKMVLRRGFALRPGEKTVVVEDVVTTGKSTGEVLAVLKEAGAQLLGALTIVDRSAGALSLGVELKSLLRLPLKAFPADACPACAAGRPVLKPGSRPLP